jgi:hypothetical protein
VEEWRLFTDRTAMDFADAFELIDGYRYRRGIELFFNLLKNGCHVEALQLSIIAKLELVLAAHLMLAWLSARLVLLGSTYPALTVNAFISPDR